MHNHEVASTVLGHPYARRLTDVEQDMIVNASGMFLKPKAISDMLVKADPQNVTSRKQIANFKHNLLLKDRGNMIVCQTTLSFLHEKGYRVRTQTHPETNKLKIMFLYTRVIVVDEAFSLFDRNGCDIQDKQVRICHSISVLVFPYFLHLLFFRCSLIK